MKPNVPLTDNFDQWRVKNNQISDNVGDPAALNTTIKTSLVDAVNGLVSATSVTGSRASGAALQNLLTVLAAKGIITDNTTA